MSATPGGLSPPARQGGGVRTGAGDVRQPARRRADCSSLGGGWPTLPYMPDVVTRWTWVAAFATILVIATADWVAHATVPETWTYTDGGRERVEFGYAPASGTIDWWLLSVPRVLLPVCVVAAVWTAAGRRRAAVGWTLAAAALLAVVLLRVALHEPLAIRGGVLAAEAAVAAAGLAALRARRRQRDS